MSRGKSLQVKKAIRLEEGRRRGGGTAKKSGREKSAKSAMIPFAPHANLFVKGAEIKLKPCNYLIVAPCI